MAQITTNLWPVSEPQFVVQITTKGRELMTVLKTTLLAAAMTAALG